jgi:hypothetical protein
MVGHTNTLGLGVCQNDPEVNSHHSGGTRNPGFGGSPVPGFLGGDRIDGLSDTS